MICSRRLYKGESYEICLPLTDTGVTSVRFYTTGDIVIEKEPEIVDDTMCFVLNKEDLDILPDGVLRYSYDGYDGNTGFVVVTPADYSGSTLEELLEDAYDSGYTAGQEDCSGETRDIDFDRRIFGPNPNHMIPSGSVSCTEVVHTTGCTLDTTRLIASSGGGFSFNVWSEYFENHGEYSVGWVVPENPTNQDRTGYVECTFYDTDGNAYSGKTITFTQKAGTGSSCDDAWASGYTSGYTDASHELGIGYHKLNVILSSSEIAGLIDEAEVTVNVSGQPSTTKTYQGSNLAFDIIPGTSYTLSFSNVMDYATPGDETGNTYWSGSSTVVGNYVYSASSVSGEYLTFRCISSGTLVWYGARTDENPASLYCRKNGGEWYLVNMREQIADMVAGDIVEVKGTSADAIYYPGFFIGRQHFDGTGYFDIYGDLSSLNLWTPSPVDEKYYGLFSGFKVVDASRLDLSNVNITKSCFEFMFGNCTALTAAPSLPATNILHKCYKDMFAGCSSLRTAPALPATTLYGGCYNGMFRSCTSLTSAPALPATTIPASGYMEMFQDCSSLTTAPELPATGLSEYCYIRMFQGCTSLTSASVLPATTLATSCYESMFAGCTSLVNAPALPATGLGNYCYSSMFNGCASLTGTPALTANTLKDGCYSNMFYGCTSLTDAPNLPAMNLATHCYNGMFGQCTSLTGVPTTLPATTLAGNCYEGMFNGCTSLTTAPELPATTLVNNCYGWMFYNCENLNYIKCMATNAGTEGAYTPRWTYNVPITGTFVKNPNSTWITSTDGIPYGWTVEDAVIE